MKTRTIALTILSLIILMGFGIPTMSQESISVEVVYDIQNDQNATVIWYDENFNPIHYNFSADDNLTVNIYDLNNSETSLDISLGNLTLTGIKDSVASNNLILSYWKLGHSLGFVANSSNWDAIKESVANLTMNVNTFNIIETSKYFGVTLSIVEIVFEDGVQSTKLEYEKNTGLLMSVETGAFGFSLSFSIVSINGTVDFFGEPQTSTSSTGTTAVPFSIVGFVAAFVIRKKK